MNGMKDNFFKQIGEPKIRNDHWSVKIGVNILYIIQFTFYVYPPPPALIGRVVILMANDVICVGFP